MTANDQKQHRSRRARGSLRQLDDAGNKWELRVPLAKRPDGRPDWLSRTFYGTEAAAQRKLEEFLVTSAGKPRADVNRTFDAAFNDWLAAPSSKTTRQRSASTVYQETRRYERHVRPVLGARPVVGVTTSDIDGIYRSLLAAGLSPTSVHRVHELIRAVLAFEESALRIPSNPATKASCPKQNEPEPVAPHPDDVSALMRVARGESAMAYALVRLVAVTGMRRSELAALRRSHIRFDQATITVEFGDLVVPTPTGPSRVQTDTKTGRGAVLGLDDSTLDALQALIAEQDRLAHLCGTSVSPAAYLFASDVGCDTGLHPDSFSTLMSRLSESLPAGVNIRLKDLRVFVATELEADGEDLTTAQAVLRHASPITTMRHYRAAKERRVRMATRSLGDRLRPN
jgi:integrase